MNLLSFVSAHTGNDTINHGITFLDVALTLVLVVAGIFLAKRIIKGKKKTKN